MKSLLVQTLHGPRVIGNETGILIIGAVGPPSPLPRLSRQPSQAPPHKMFRQHLDRKLGNPALLLDVGNVKSKRKSKPVQHLPKASFAEHIGI